MEELIPDYQGRRLLIVEDNHLNMEIFKEIIGQTNIEIEEAYDGTEAVEKIANSKEGYYDLVLSDIQMLFMNGYAMAKSIRAMNRCDSKIIPILGMTADVNDCSIEAAREAGMDDQIYKPFGIEEIAEKMNKYLKGNGTIVIKYEDE